jgi:FKBP-type peptidyl-prolyl cis-trans isomerase
MSDWAEQRAVELFPVNPEYRPRVAQALRDSIAKSDRENQQLCKLWKDYLVLHEQEKLIAEKDAEIKRLKERRCMYNQMRKDNLALARKQCEENLKLQTEIDRLKGALHFSTIRREEADRKRVDLQLKLDILQEALK